MDLYQVGEEVKELRFGGYELSALRDTANRIRMKLGNRDLERSGVASDKERLMYLRIIGNVGSIATNAVGRGKQRLTLTGTDVPAIHTMLERADVFSDPTSGLCNVKVHELTPREYEIHELTRRPESVAVLANQVFTLPPFLR